MHSDPLISTLVAADFQPVYRFFYYLTESEALALSLAQETFVAAITSLQVRRSGWCSRKDLLAHALRILDARRDLGAFIGRDPFRFLRAQAGLTAEEVQDLSAHAAAAQLRRESDLFPTVPDPPALDAQRLAAVSGEIHAQCRRLGGRQQARSAALETTWTVFIIGLILLVTFLVEARQTAPRGEGELPPLAFQPSPQSVTLGPASGAPDKGWGLLRLVESLLFPVASVGFSASGQAYVAGHWDGWIVFCDLDNRFQAVPSDDLNPSLDDIAISSERNLLATGTYAGEVVIWQLSWLEPAQRIYTLADHPGRIRSLRFSDSGEFLAVGTGQGTWLWQIEDLARRAHIFTGRNIDRIAFSASGNWLATLEEGNEVWIRALPGGRAIQRITGFSEPIRELLFSQDDRLMVVAGGEGGLRVWRADQPPDEQTGTASLFSIAALPLDPDSQRIAGPAMAPDGSRLLLGTESGALISAARQNGEGEASQGPAFFERMAVNGFGSGEISQINPGCSQAGWKRSLLNQNFLLLAGSAAADLPGAHFQPGGGAVFLGRGERRALVTSSLFLVEESPAQNIYLVVHGQSDSSGAPFVFDFLDIKIGQRAQVEAVWIGGVPIEIVRGSWQYAIIDTPDFVNPQQPPESVNWTASWESESGRQTLRWQDGGVLFELILLPGQSGSLGHTEAAVDREILLDLAREIIHAAGGDGSQP
jgi:hypothetical protein